MYSNETVSTHVVLCYERLSHVPMNLKKDPGCHLWRFPSLLFVGMLAAAFRQASARLKVYKIIFTIFDIFISSRAILQSFAVLESSASWLTMWKYSKVAPRHLSSPYMLNGMTFHYLLCTCQHLVLFLIVWVFLLSDLKLFSPTWNIKAVLPINY